MALRGNLRKEGNLELLFYKNCGSQQLAQERPI